MGKSKKFNNFGGDEINFRKVEQKQSRKNVGKNKAFDPEYFEDFDEILDFSESDDEDIEYEDDNEDEY